MPDTPSAGRPGPAPSTHLVDGLHAGDAGSPIEDRIAVAVFAPAPHLEISVELSADEDAEVHVHAGGQGYWIARMIDTLGSVPWLCAPVGGELGMHFRTGLHRLPDVGLVEVATPTPARIIDRRQDRRGVCWTLSPPSVLDRHELDDLFTRTLGLAVECGTCVVSGTGGDATVPTSVFERLARDLAAVGVTVVADISGDEFAALLDGGAPDVVKLSDEELVADGWAADGELASLRDGVDALHDRGVDTVVITRAGSGALLAHDGRLQQLVGPELSPVNSRGAGDSLTAAVATRLAHGDDPVEAVRLGVAAGALNATRHGLGSGECDAIEALAAQVEIEEIA